MRAQADMEGKSLYAVCSRGSFGRDPFLTGLAATESLVVNFVIREASSAPPSPDTPAWLVQKRQQEPQVPGRLGFFLCGDDAWCDRLCLAASLPLGLLRNKKPALLCVTKTASSSHMSISRMNPAGDQQLSC